MLNKKKELNVEKNKGDDLQKMRKREKIQIGMGSRENRDN